MIGNHGGNIDGQAVDGRIELEVQRLHQHWARLRSSIILNACAVGLPAPATIRQVHADNFDRLAPRTKDCPGMAVAENQELAFVDPAVRAPLGQGTSARFAKAHHSGCDSRS